MVTFKKSLILACAGLALSGSSLVMAFGSTVRLNDSRGLTVSTVYSPAISYAFENVANAPSQRYVAEVHMDDFLMCNEFADTGNTSNTGLYLRPVHGAWLIGSKDSDGVSGSFTRISDLAYIDGQLDVTTCDETGTGAGCGGASLQCFTADAHGGSVADTRDIFATGFDEYTAAANSSVYITVTHVPATAGEQFTYDIHYTTPGASAATAGSTSSPQSLSNNVYVLTEGYDRNVFTSCNVVFGTQPQVGTPLPSSQSGVIQRSCWMVNPGSALPGDVPVVSATLFTSPAVSSETTFSDNVAFGYPVVSAPQ
ncbi:MAG: hypothetical protein WCD36_13590 [Rhodanobacteraceae bacterium]